MVSHACASDLAALQALGAQRMRAQLRLGAIAPTLPAIPPELLAPVCGHHLLSMRWFSDVLNSGKHKSETATLWEKWPLAV